MEAKLFATLTMYCRPQEGIRLNLHTDVSYQGLDAVLSTWSSGIFFKEALLTERYYAVTQLKCLAAYKVIDNFAVHLLVHTFRWSQITEH